MLTEFFSSLSFYFIPYLTGSLLTRKIFYAWILGTLFWFITYFIAEIVVSFFPLLTFSSLIKFLLIFVNIIGFTNLLIRTIAKRKLLFRIDRLQIVSFFFIAIASTLVYFVIWKERTPYPLQLNWDIYEHIALANKIVEGHLSFMPSKISDTFTFNGYSPLFHILLSIPKILFNTSLLGVYWWLEYWHYLLTIAAFLFLAKNIFQNKWLTFIAVVVASFIFESTTVYSSLFLIPQTLVALIVILAIYGCLENRNGNIAYSIMITSFMILTHYVVGAVGSIVYITFNLLQRRVITTTLIKIIILVSSVVFVVTLGIHYIGKWDLIPREEASYFNSSLLTKINYFFDWYSVALPLFLFLGYWEIIKTGTLQQKIILILGLLTLSLSLLPFSYFLKFYTVGRYFINIVFVAGIGALMLYLPSKLRVFATCWIVVLLSIVFYTNQAFYKKPLYFKGEMSHVSREEIEASSWLSKHVDPNSLIISDPSTQHVIEGLSEINTQGGAYMNIRTRRILSDINYTYDIKQIRQNIKSIHDLLPYEQKKETNRLFILSGRYFAWQRLSENQKNSFFYNIWVPHKIEDTDYLYIEFLLSSDSFNKVYENNELVVLELL